MSNNPFAVISPEDLTAVQADQLFVEMYSDYPDITRPGNTLITGARGCGKSMLIRCSMPDVMMIRMNKQFEQLDSLAFCVPIKKTSLNLQELRKLDDRHAPYMINEHFLTLHVMMHILFSLSEMKFSNDSFEEEAYRDFFEKCFLRYLKAAGFQGTIDVDYKNPNTFFSSLYEGMFLMVCEFVPYLKSLFSGTEDLSYNLPLLSYMRFVIPVMKRMCSLPGFPPNVPVYIFIDDADNLSVIQTQILNSWLLCRTQPGVSLKVSSQIGMYKTFLTSSGILVESPHDYQEVNISYLYTTKSRDFYEKSVSILEKRLKLFGLNTDPHSFFPVDIEQEKRIKAEEEIIRKEYEEKGRGYRESDDVRRYAIPNYIKHLGGTHKSRMTYKYAGLDNIIHLSSGIIRYLLDATAKMYDRAKNDQDDENIIIDSISPSIQDAVMREKADYYLFNELRKSDDDAENSISVTSMPRNNADKLGNLINAMGKTFHEILVSDRAERKVFSIALTNIPDQELKDVFALGVRLGFLHETYIGNKEGNGRTLLYVLNRCFAPVFTLDPTGFQGYLFMTNHDLKIAIMNGKKLRNIDSAGQNDVYQLSFEDILFD